MTDSNATFQADKTYQMTFVTDHQLRPEFVCTRRTAKTAWFDSVKTNETLRRRIKTDTEGNEYIVDGSYSMAPVINSKRVVN